MKPYELIRELMRREGIGAYPLARKLGRPNLQPPIHRFINGNVDQPLRATAEALAGYFNISVDAIYKEADATQVAIARGLVEDPSSSQEISQPDAPKGGIDGTNPGDESPAHVLSDQVFRITPRIAWRNLTVELPELFEVMLEDDAMAPEFPAGTVIKFRRGSDAQFGNRVLVRTKKGFHFRQFAESATDAWQANASHKAFIELYPARDGATVVAVKTGHVVEGA